MEIETQGNDEIVINTKSLAPVKKYLFKDKFVTTFSFLTLFSIVIFLSQIVGFSLGIDILVMLADSFSYLAWALAAICFALSGVLAYHGKYKWMLIPVLIWILFITAEVRTSNISGLINAATGEPVLGPDLDPYLFLRHAIEISEGSLQEPDLMRLTPHGSENAAYNNMMPWMIFGMYKVMSWFGDYSVTEAAILAPAVFFLVSVVGFFFFVYTLFSFRLSQRKSMVGATIASFFYVFVPAMIHRTIAGIPEIESLGMMWYWPALLFFALAWKQKLHYGPGLNLIKNNWKLVLYATLSGIFTGAMSWTWGGYKYIYMTIALASFLGFLFKIQPKKNLLILGSFLVTGLLIEFTSLSFSAVVFSFADTGFSLAVFAIMCLDRILFRTRIRSSGFVRMLKEKVSLPESVLSILVFVVFGAIFLSILKPGFILDVFSGTIEKLLYPFGRSRVGLTVAENKAPYFKEVLNNFGSMTWLFLLGIVLIFYESIKHFNPKKRFAMNFFFWIFIITFTFSKLSSDGILNGENLISKTLYLGGLILFAIFLIFIYIKSYLKRDEKTFRDFSEIDFSYLVLLAISFWGIVSMRGAIRLFFIIAPTIIIVSSYFLVKIFDYRRSKDSLIRVLVFGGIILSLILSVSAGVSYIDGTTKMAERTIPDVYSGQWHYAMDWIEQNTPKTSVFAHWWDYGYWVQTLGKRATIADGGQPGGQERNHFIGRYILTAQNHMTAVNALKTFNATHLLIDSTDAGKYGAYSKIGSDHTGQDRFGNVPVFPLDRSQTATRGETTVAVFYGGIYADEDIVYTDDRGVHLLPEGKAVLGGIVLEYQVTEEEVSFVQPQGLFFYNQEMYEVPLRYIYYDGEILEFSGGIESIIRLVPGFAQTDSGSQVDRIGAAIYLSNKTKSSLFSQMYILNNVEKKHPSFRLVHTEDDLVVENLRAQGAYMGEFVYYQGLRGPIKIWEINYPAYAEVHEEYLQPQNLERDNSWGKLDYLGV